MVHVLGARPLAAAAEELVAEAYVRGGRDNITLVVVRVVDGDYCAASSSASSSLGPAARAPSGGAKRP